MDSQLINILASIVGTAAPLLIAAQGELLTERAGVVNLSLDGTILLAAMTAFAVAYQTDSTWAGIFAAMLVGMGVALFIISANVVLRVNQIAIGFVLTLLCADLSSYLGQDFTGLPAGQVEIPSMPIPLLSDVPVIGEIFFQQNAMVYFSLLLTVGVSLFLYRTRPGLALRGLGERPEAAYARGVPVQSMRFFYVALGGALVGLAGAAYSLDVELGWRDNLTLGQGWIALAIVIFGAWKPFRVLLGAYLIIGLGQLALYLQRQQGLDVPVHILNMLPWLMMLLTLMFAVSGAAERLARILPVRMRPAVSRWLRSDPPAALGADFERK